MVVLKKNVKQITQNTFNLRAFPPQTRLLVVGEVVVLVL